MGNGKPSDGTRSVLFGATPYGAWKGAVFPFSAGLVFIAAGLSLSARGVIITGLACVLAAALRATWWARASSTSQLLDRDNALVWMYRGEVRARLPWADLRHVVFQRGSRQVMWSLGSKTGGPFPHLLVDARTDPPPGFRYFADVMLLNRDALKAADQTLADACRRYGVTYHGVDSDW